MRNHLSHIAIFSSLSCFVLSILSCTTEKSDMEKEGAESRFVTRPSNNSVPEVSTADVPQFGGHEEETKKRENGEEDIENEDESLSENLTSRMSWNGRNLTFFPTNAHLILIFEGSFLNLDDALVNSKGSVARVPAKLNCNRSKGNCLQSPIQIPECIGCETLESGKNYSVFLQLVKGANTSSLRPLPLQFSTPNSP